MKRFIVVINSRLRCHDVVNDTTDEVVASFDWDAGVMRAALDAEKHANSLNYDDAKRSTEKKPD